MFEPYYFCKQKYDPIGPCWKLHARRWLQSTHPVLVVFKPALIHFSRMCHKSVPHKVWSPRRGQGYG